jgi:4a-hydroxytetrahydrobiopterin dehydratase
MGKLKEEILLASRQCGSCGIADHPLGTVRCDSLVGQLSDGWAITEGRLEKEFIFKNFRQALEMVNVVGVIAEEQGHHPNIFLTWGKVKITLFTHKVGGLTVDDFILASKIDRL